MATPADDAPPPRERWEEPGPGLWRSTVGPFAREGAALAAALVAAALAVTLLWAAGGAPPRRHAKAAAAAAAGRYALAALAAAGALLYAVRRRELLGLVGAMLTDHGRVARLHGRPPVWLDAPPEGGLRLAHLSDLHVAEGEGVRLVERPRPAGNGALARLLDDPAVKEAELVLVTGDVTDRGTAASWRCFLAALDARGLAARTVLVPGNHDVAYADHVTARRALRQDRLGLVQVANLLKFGEASLRTAGGRLGAVVVGGHVAPFAEAFAAASGAVRPLLDELAAAPTPAGHGPHARAAWGALSRRVDEARDRLLELFPIAVPLPGREAVLFVLNSCARRHVHMGTNALGRVGADQYARLDRLARRFPQRLRLVALHHHLVRRPEERSVGLARRVQAKLTVLPDARPLAGFCRREGVRAVFHGHRHLSYQLRLPNGTVLLAAPSSTLGDELAQDPRPQLERYDLADPPSAGTVGIFRRVIHPSAAGEVAAPAAG